MVCSQVDPRDAAGAAAADEGTDALWRPSDMDPARGQPALRPRQGQEQDQTQETLVTGLVTSESY